MHTFMNEKSIFNVFAKNVSRFGLNFIIQFGCAQHPKAGRNTQHKKFHAHFSFVLQKMSKICVNPVAKKTFENKFTQYTCKDILDYNNTKAICNDKNEANTTMVQANKDFTEFLFA